MVIQNYIEYKKDDKDFLEHLKTTKEKNEAEQRTSDESSK
jgi:predicted CopG family antitoxin